MGYSRNYSHRCTIHDYDMAMTLPHRRAPQTIAGVLLEWLFNIGGQYLLFQRLVM